MLDFFKVFRVQLEHIAAVGNLVFTERVDWHHGSAGEPALSGTMEFNEADKIRRWADFSTRG